MPASRPPRANPTTIGEAAILAEVDRHAADKNNPHGTKLSQLADLTNSGAGTAGQVPTLQADGTYQLITPPGAAGGAPVGSATPKSATFSGSAGVSASSSREDHAHPSIVIGPEDYAFAGWTMDPMFGTATWAMAAGTMYFARAKVTKTGAISNVIVPITTGGSSLTGAWVAVYALDGTLLGQSADQASSWQSAGTKTVALSSPTASQAAGTTVLVALLATGTTGPSIRASAAAPTLNQNIGAAAGYRSGSLAGQTAIPSPVTLSSTSSSQQIQLLFLS